MLTLEWKDNFVKETNVKKKPQARGTRHSSAVRADATPYARETTNTHPRGAVNLNSTRKHALEGVDGLKAESATVVRNVGQGDMALHSMALDHLWHRHDHDATSATFT
ncbi:hypothetical protein PMIN06_010288 [Paraphaeosphaeria minitans]